jgi:hypothetical protein
MLGMVARYKRKRNRNKINVENNENNENNENDEIMNEKLNYYSSINKYRVDQCISIYNNIDYYIKKNYINELNRDIYDEKTALNYCILNINTTNIKHFRKKSFAKLLYKLLQLNIDLNKQDKYGVTPLMYLCKNITKHKYLKLVEIYLETCKKNNIKIYNVTTKEGLTIYDYIEKNISYHNYIKKKLKYLIYRNVINNLIIN